MTGSAQRCYFRRDGRKGLSEEVTVETSLKISAKIWSENILGRRSSSCEGSTGISVVGSRTARAGVLEWSE